MNKFQLYELKKQALKRKNLSPRQYEEAVRKLARSLKV